MAYQAHKDSGQNNDCNECSFQCGTFFPATPESDRERKASGATEGTCAAWSGILNLCGAGETITASAAEIAEKIFLSLEIKAAISSVDPWWIIHKGKKFIQFLFSLYPPDGENMVPLSDKSGSGFGVGNEPSRKGFHSNKAPSCFSLQRLTISRSFSVAK